jgi:hypothetical protein
MHFLIEYKKFGDPQVEFELEKKILKTWCIEFLKRSQ